MYWVFDYTNNTKYPFHDRESAILFFDFAATYTDHYLEIDKWEG